MAIDFFSNHPVGFRFHPTDAELVSNYLMPMIQGRSFPDVIAEIDLCQSEPWELPQKSKIKSKDSVWWFLCRRDYKSPSSKRLKRTTPTGFWKITGQERLIKDAVTKQCLGRKKTLVFYCGTAPGKRTNWVMQEIYLDPASTFTNPHHQMDAYVICKLKRKTDQNAETPEGEIHHSEDEFVNSLHCEQDEGNFSNPLSDKLKRKTDQNAETPEGEIHHSEDEFVNSLLCEQDEGNFSDPLSDKLKRKTDQNAETPEGDHIHHRAITASEEEEPNRGVITKEDVLRLLDEHSEDERVNNFLRDPDKGHFSDDPSSIAQRPSKRPYFTNAKGTIELRFQGLSSCNYSAAAGLKKVRHSTMEKTPSKPTSKLQLQSRGPNPFSDAVALENVGPTNGGGYRYTVAQAQHTMSLSICLSPYEYCFNMLVGTVLFAILVVFGEMS